MLITRQSDYALRIIRALIGGKSKTAAEISNEQQIPQQFAHKIIRKLKNSGIIDVTRGVDGGCSLAADPDGISLYDVLSAVEENTQVNSCTEGDYSCPWKEEHSGCSISCKLSDLQHRLDLELKNMTISSMMQDGESNDLNLSS